MSNDLAADLDGILARTGNAWHELRDSRVFITGGTGFLGCWLLESFLWANDSLGLNARATVLTRNPELFQAKAPHLCSNPAVTLHRGDVRSFDYPSGTFSHVVHAACDASAQLNERDPALMLDTVVTGTRRVLQFAKQSGTQKLLLTSSGVVYGPPPDEMTHVPESYLGGPDVTTSRSAYAEGKRMAELLSCIASSNSGLEVKIARCFAFVGPFMRFDAHFAIGNFIRDGVQQKSIEVKGDGTAVRSYLYAADLMVWLWTILFRGKLCRAYNVGSEEAITIGELAQMVAGLSSPKLPVTIQRQPGASRRRDVYVPLTARAREELGLSHQISLADAIRKTQLWLCSRSGTSTQPPGRDRAHLPGKITRD
jgi:nucleoside-diphosphate-sugar epimerase